VVAAAAAPLLLGAGPAFAKLKPDEGEIPGPSLGTGQTILLFVVIPVGVFLVITALSLLPSTLARPRYRPGRPWGHPPRWIGGPEPLTTAPPPPTEPPTAHGGASAEW
jgi:hypothetical protein